MSLTISFPSEIYQYPCGKSLQHLHSIHLHFADEHMHDQLTRLCTVYTNKMHGLLCHVPKCTQLGHGPQATQLQHHCTSYHASFRTASWLAQHERHRHPLKRNQHRIGQPHSSGNEKPTLGKVWTEEEAQKLIARVQGLEEAKGMNGDHLNKS